MAIAYSIERVGRTELPERDQQKNPFTMSLATHLDAAVIIAFILVALLHK
jgi:hypothetical protein